MTATSDALTSMSNGLADAVAAAAPHVVQVRGGGRPASGLVYAADIVLTTVDVLKHEDGLHVRGADDVERDAELAGWDPTTSLAVLRVPDLGGAPIRLAEGEPRVGHLALAIARSWSNAITAGAGVISVIGGPLPRGRRRAIEQVIRTTAPVHDGFAGGAFVDTAGALIGVTTSMTIRRTTVVIPAPIAWSTATAILEHGRVSRGYFGIMGQPVQLPDAQRSGDHTEALLIVDVTPDSPAAKSGLLVGDLLLQAGDQTIGAPEDLLDVLAVSAPGRVLPLRVLRGGAVAELTVTVGERPQP